MFSLRRFESENVYAAHNLSFPSAANVLLMIKFYAGRLGRCFTDLCGRNLFNAL